MLLSQLLTQDVILPELKATDRWECLGELLDAIVASGKISADSRKSVYDLLVYRENLMTTGIGHGIAIPHASYEGVTEIVAGFGRSPKGISFDSLDGKPVTYVTMLIVPKTQFQTHLKTLSILAKFYNDPEKRKAIDGAKTAEEIYKCFDLKID